MNPSRDHRSGASWGMSARRAAAGLRPAVMCPTHIRPAAATCFGTRGAPRELAVADRPWLPAGYRSQLASSLLHVSAAEVPRALARTPIRHSFRDGEMAAVSRAELPIRAFFAALVACGQELWPRR